MVTPISGSKGISGDRTERLRQMASRIEQGLQSAGGRDAQAQAARTVLTSLMGKLDGQGKPRSGYLKLIHSTDSTREMAFKTKSGWGMKLTADRNQETAAALRALFQAAGYSTDKLDAYLSQRKTAGKARLQSGEVLKLLKEQIGEPRLPDSTVLSAKNVGQFFKQRYVDDLLKDEGYSRYVSGLCRVNSSNLRGVLMGKTAGEALAFLDEHHTDYLKAMAVQMEGEDEAQAQAPVNELLREAGLKPFNVPNDGHCAFHALAVAEGGERRRAFDADPYAANDQHRLDLHTCLSALTEDQMKALKWTAITRAESESRLLAGLYQKRVTDEAWGGGQELALKAIECGRRVISLVPGQINIYHPDGSSRVIQDPDRHGLKGLLQDPKWDSAGAPLIVWNETNTHWQATEPLGGPSAPAQVVPPAEPGPARVADPVGADKAVASGAPSYLHTFKRAQIDGAEQPISLGGAAVDGDCGLHALNHALGLQLTRATVADAVIGQLDDIQGPDDARYQMMYEDILHPNSGVLQPGEPRFSFEAFKVDRQGWAARWREAFAGEGGKERLWISDLHIQWISQSQGRPVQVFVPSLEDPAVLALSRSVNPELPGPPIRLVNTDSNVQRGRRELDRKVQEFFEHDDLTLNDLLLARQGSFEHLDPEALFALPGRLEEEYPDEDLPANIDNPYTARIDQYLQSLLSQQVGNHWDAIDIAVDR